MGLTRKNCILTIKSLRRIVKDRTEQMKGIKKHLNTDDHQPGYLQNLFYGVMGGKTTKSNSSDASSDSDEADKPEPQPKSEGPKPKPRSKSNKA